MSKQSKKKPRLGRDQKRAVSTRKAPRIFTEFSPIPAKEKKLSPAPQEGIVAVVKRGRPLSAFKANMLKADPVRFTKLAPEESKKILDSESRNARLLWSQVTKAYERTSPHRKEYKDLLTVIKDAVEREIIFVDFLINPTGTNRPVDNKRMAAGLITELGKRIESIRLSWERITASPSGICAWKNCNKPARRKYCSDKCSDNDRKRRENLRRHPA